MNLTLPDLAQRILATLRSLQMYTANHPRAREASQLLLDKLNEHFKRAPVIKILANAGHLFLDGQMGDSNIHTTNFYAILNDRLISGIQLERGLELAELINLLELLILRPQQLDAMGGAEAALRAKNARHAQLTQTKLAEAGEAEGVTTAASAPPEEPNEERERHRLYGLWHTGFRECIEIAIKEAEGTSWFPSYKGALPPANLKDTGRLAIRLKWETNPPPTVHWEAVRLALENLTAAEQLSVVSGRASLPDIPPSLNKVLDAFIPGILSKAAIALDDQGADWNGLKEAIYFAITAKDDADELYKIFETHWLKSGKDAARASEIKNYIQWDYSPLDSQLASVEKPEFMWSMPESQLNRLIARVMKQTSGAIQNLLEKIVAAGNLENPSLRERAARALEFIALSAGTFAISNEAERTLIQSLAEDFGKEAEPQIAAIKHRCIRRMFDAFMSRNDFSRATWLLRELNSRCAYESSASQKGKALAEIKSRLCIRANIEPVIQKCFELGSDYFQGTAQPWLKALGASAVEYLMEMLSEESDRRRRGQIMDAIRSYGGDILPYLVKSLDSDKWYLVRNTLILIAEMADQSCFSGVVKCLKHSDLRVKRTAARTLWRGFGKQAAGPLLNIFEEAEPEVFEEILFGLAQIEAPSAIAVVTEYAVETKNPDNLRVMALNALASNPSRDSLPALIELVKRKGRIITTSGPLEIRVAAAKAMVAIGQEGRYRLHEILRSEPNGAERDELNLIMEL